MAKPIKYYPFTENQLRYFKKEIEDAGGIYQLMFQKEALKDKDGLAIITLYKDIEEYKQKYLVGIYQPLRTYYKSKVPYIFWKDMFSKLKLL